MAGEQSGTGEQNAGGEDIQQLKSQMETLGKELESVKAAKSELEKHKEDTDKELLGQDYLDFLESKKGKGKSTASEEIINEGMTPPQIVKHLETKYKGDLEKVSKDLAERLDSIEDAMGKTVAQIDLALTGLKHKEFGDAFNTSIKERTVEQKQLVDKVFNVANENPNWSAEKCYRQARIELRAEQDELGEKERIKAEQERKALSEKGGVSSYAVQGKQVTKDQASDLAWKTAFGNKKSVE